MSSYCNSVSAPLHIHSSPTHSLSLRSPKFQRDLQPLGTTKSTQTLGTLNDRATSWGEKNHTTARDKKITKPLRTHWDKEKNHTTSRDKKNNHPTSGDQKNKKNHATSWNNKKFLGQKKSHNLSGFLCVIVYCMGGSVGTMSSVKHI